MLERPDVPVFGSRVAGCPYVVRPSAYVLVKDSGGRIAVVRTPKGHFLPGGGAESGETLEQTAAREALEECGLVLADCKWLVDAIEIVHSPAENACFEKRSVFFVAGLQGMAVSKEPDHELLWLTPLEAMERLCHGSHRWAVSRLNQPILG